jgi:hypothetical protein
MFDAALKGDKLARDAIAKALPEGSRFAANIAAESPEQAKADKDYAEADDRDIASEDADRRIEKENKRNARKKADEEDRKFAEADDVAIANEEAERKRKKSEKKDAVERADKKSAGTGLDARVEKALLRSSLANGGQPGAASAEVAKALSKELQARGMGEREADLAAKEKVRTIGGKLGDDINAEAVNPKKRGIEHIGTADFARSVESKGADKLLDNTEAMKERLTDLVRIANGGARVG